MFFESSNKSRNAWAQCFTIKNGFWVVVDRLSITSPPLFGDTEEDEDRFYIIFDGHPMGEDVVIAPRYILRMRLKREEHP